jgi:hypothetical protein
MVKSEPLVCNTEMDRYPLFATVIMADPEIMVSSPDTALTCVIPYFVVPFNKIQASLNPVEDEENPTVYVAMTTIVRPEEFVKLPEEYVNPVTPWLMASAVFHVRTVFDPVPTASDALLFVFAIIAVVFAT